MKKLYFVRHGLTEMNVAGLWSGSTETSLTNDGRAQARKAGQAAKALGIDAIVSSTMGRAVETAQIIAKEIGYPAENIHTSSLLIERHFGALEGQPYFPDLNMDGVADVESVETLLGRAKLALEWINTIPGNTILIVSHGSTGRAIRHVLHPEIPFKGNHFPNAEIRELLQTNDINPSK